MRLMLIRQFCQSAVLCASLLVVGCAPQIEPALPTYTFSPPPTAAATATPSPTLTATPQPTLKPTPTEIEIEIEIEKGETVTFTIVYDNNAYDPALQTKWGFACWVKTGESTLLFDTGGDGATLLSNMDTLGLDPREIDAVVLSHAHGDHTGGLGVLLSTGITPTVYAPAAFPASFKDGVRARAELVEVTGPMEILPGLHTTGEMGAGIIEQALAVETEAGLVVVTGCAHPGVEKLARRAKESVGPVLSSPGQCGEVYLVMGGFHLGGASQSRVEDIIADFRNLGVQRVAPCHCTGDQARQMFADAFGEDYIPAGAGRVIILGAGGVE